MPTHRKETTVGVIYALLCYGLWGLTPIYWKAIEYVPAQELLAQRVVWSALFLAGLLLIMGRFHELKPILVDFRRLRWLMLSAALISVNWGTYIWTVESGHIMQASLGYYINPLVSVLLGRVVLQERSRPLQWAAIALAAAGTLNLAFSYGVVPWLSFILAFSFGFYGLVRKMAPAGPMVGLLVETLLIGPVALGYLGWLHHHGAGHFGNGDRFTDLMLAASALVTALPLLWFTNGAKRLRLSTMGLFQYIAPTGQLLLAVLVYGEVFTRAYAMTFALIWFALALYTFDTVRVQRRSWTWRHLDKRPGS